MAITVVGSVAFDTVETPAGRRERCLAGAATYFSLSASFFTDVRVIAVVGEDFGASGTGRLRCTQGRHSTASSTPPARASFGKARISTTSMKPRLFSTDLNVFAGFEPKIPDAYRDSQFLFLANIDPVLQRRVREAMPQAKLVAGDTMNYWIKDHKPALLEVLKGLDILLINDTEARMLAGNNNLVLAARAVMEMGPRMLVVKHGEYGATLFHRAIPGAQESRTFKSPAFPLEQVTDPTGAGDSFAGGFFGYLASQTRTHARCIPASHVLWLRHGFIRGGALWHRASAAADSRRNRPPLQAVP